MRNTVLCSGKNRNMVILIKCKDIAIAKMHSDILLCNRVLCKGKERGCKFRRVGPVFFAQGSQTVADDSDQFVLHFIKIPMLCKGMQPLLLQMGSNRIKYGPAAGFAIFFFGLAVCQPPEAEIRLFDHDRDIFTVTPLLNVMGPGLVKTYDTAEGAGSFFFHVKRVLSYVT